jgi:hypothetical protein
MCWKPIEEERTKPLPVRQYRVDPEIKLNYIRSQAKLLGFGAEIYRSKRPEFKYVIFRNFAGPVPEDSDLMTGKQNEALCIREIHFGTTMWNMGMKDWRYDFLDTNDDEQRVLWHLYHQNNEEYNDEYCATFYEGYLLF